jgi:hypothetical protein
VPSAVDPGGKAPHDVFENIHEQNSAPERQLNPNYRRRSNQRILAEQGLALVELSHFGQSDLRVWWVRLTPDTIPALTVVVWHKLPIS